jgi:hypothetical protein
VRGVNGFASLQLEEVSVQIALHGEKERGNVDEMRVGDHVCVQVPGSTSWHFPVGA